MTPTEQEIFATLMELDEKVRAMAMTQPKPNLLPLFARLEELTRQLPKNTNPDLLHYLHRKSYEKALLFLKGRGAENARGSCGH